MRPFTVEETVLFVCIEATFSLLDISMWTRIASSVHYCNSECCRASFWYELLTLLCLLCLKKSSN